MMNYTMEKKNAGFTLMEMLVVIVIGFIIVLLVYQTMQSTIRVSAVIQEKITDMQRVNFFLTSFSSRLLCIVPDSKNNSFTSSKVSIELDEYNSRKIITYEIEPDETGKFGLTVGEKDILLNTECSYPGLSGLDSIEFSFFDGDSWLTDWDKDTLPQGIAITFVRNGSKIFFPVKLDIQSVQET